MILLVGGTSETAPLARALLEAGYQVLVSLATEVELAFPDHPGLRVRRGRLDRHGFQDLIAARRIACVVDASHPFAAILRQELVAACLAGGAPRVRFERPGAAPGGLSLGYETVDDHEAAAVAVTFPRRPVLLTTGSRCLAPYVRSAREADIPLFARILPGEESRAACRLAGIAEINIEFARGPHTVDQTRALLRRWDIGVLVAKDGGMASGLAERLEAALAEDVRVVVVRRPLPENAWVGNAREMLERVRELVPTSTNRPPHEPNGSITREERLANLGLAIPRILLPGPEVDLSLWPVVACDQHVHDDAYWRRSRLRVDEEPSTLSLVLPESELEDLGLGERIGAIHRSMNRFLRQRILRPEHPGLVVVRRLDPGRESRVGLLLAFDLETWHMPDRRRFALRPTEEVVEDRLPARLAIRQGAALELPHLLALVDDPQGTFGQALEISSGRELYRIPVPESTGTISGTLVEAGGSLESLTAALEALAHLQDPDAPVWFVGDGNHSLEAARRHWNELRTQLDASGIATHPARYLMAELLPLQSPGLSILPVHRKILGISPEALRLGFEAVHWRSEPCGRAELKDALQAPEGQAIGGWSDGRRTWRLVSEGNCPTHFNALVDGVLESLQCGTPQARIDYLHGWDEVDPADGDACTILARAPSRRELARAFAAQGAYPRKTFSLGGPSDKRHYLEARAIR